MARKMDDNLIGERREQLIQAAAICFARKGYHRTTVRDIAREAGLADGTLYLYFHGKKDLLLSFLEKVVLAPLLHILEQGDAQSDDRVIEEFLCSRFELAAHNGELIKVIFGEAIFDRELAELLTEKVLSPGRKALIAYVRKGVTAGRFRDADVDIVGPLLASMFFGHFLLWDVIAGHSSETPKPERLAASIKDVYLYGLHAQCPTTSRARGKGKPRNA